MTIQYTLTDEARFEISLELHNIKAISWVLGMAAGHDDVQNGEVCSLAYMIHSKTLEIIDRFNIEPDKAQA
jgi:hypothetical protein